MLGFVKYISEEARGKLKSSGAEAVRHVEKYVTPFLPDGDKYNKKGTHVISADVKGLSKGDNVVLHSHHVVTNDSGKQTHHVTVSKPGSGEKITIPLSRLHKPGEVTKNEGHAYEGGFIDHLKGHNLMPQEAKGAGSTAGTDFIIENKNKSTIHSGRVSSDERVFRGETKANTTAAFGQLTISHTKERGWHISDTARAKRPRYAAAIEQAGILHHMNANYDPDKHDIPTTASGRAKSITIKHNNLQPAESYLQDHHVDVLQVGGGYGTYSVGEHDATGHGLPRISGKGKWTVREKQAGNKRARTVMFQPDGVAGLSKSHVNLDDVSHVKAFKKTLGYTV